MREVAGEAALMIDPRAPDTLVNALVALSHTKVRQPLIARGLEQARKFNWDDVAGKLEDLVMRTLEGVGSSA
jgi:glycosyltransferase involved in cell wall biosynthesis